LSTTIKDIAKKTGLGLATISKYLNGGNVLQKNKIAIEVAIKELDYTVNEFARSLKTSKSKTIGIIIPELSNIFVTNIITVIEDILRNNGYSIIVTDCRTDENLEADLVKFLMKKRVDGIICMPVSKSGDFLKQAIDMDIPIILIDRMLDDIDTDVVMVDNVTASYKAVSYLIENGHEEIGIVAGSKDIFTSKQRLIGYKKALDKANIEFNKNNIVYSNYRVQGGYESLKKLLNNNKNISAVFMTNYEMTLGAIIAINEMGIKIPDDLSFIGFDNLQLSEVVKPKLSIVEQPLDEIGKNVAELMLLRLGEEEKKSKKKIQLTTTLIERESVIDIS
jgi:LacI family transcriptional regulator